MLVRRGSRGRDTLHVLARYENGDVEHQHIPVREISVQGTDAKKDWRYRIERSQQPPLCQIQPSLLIHDPRGFHTDYAWQVPVVELDGTVAEPDVPAAVLQANQHLEKEGVTVKRWW